MTLHERMLSMLTSAYNRNPSGNIGKLMGIFADGLDMVDAALRNVREWRDLNTAAGVVLDRIGDTYGVPRAGADDATYRLMIMTKMMATYSGGDPDTLIRAAAALIGVDESAVMLSEGTAAVTIAVDELDVPTEFFDRQDTACGLLQQAAAAGIALVLELQQPIYQSLSIGLILHDVETLTIRQVN